jgi:DNA modification methylase
MIEINKIYNENCLDTMGRMSDASIDLIVTSPPYDKLRNYETGIGVIWDFKMFTVIAKELSRILKQGRTLVWIVGDESVNHSETLTSFKHAIYFKEECGLNVNDTMIYAKKGFSFPSKNRYNQVFEYMFVLTKGKPIVFNPIKDRKNKWTQRWSSKSNVTLKDGNKKVRIRPVVYGEYGMRTNIWEYHTNAGNINPEWDILKDHPAIMNLDIAKDHIISWSNKNELVYDPFMGSGTTAKASAILRRNFIGSELSSKYVEIAQKRLYNTQLEMF